MKSLPLTKATLATAVDLLGEQHTVRLLGQLLTAQEVADLLSVPLSEIRRMTSRRELPSIRFGKRRVRYRLLDLLGFITACARPTHDHRLKNAVDSEDGQRVQQVSTQGEGS